MTIQLLPVSAEREAELLRRMREAWDLSAEGYFFLDRDGLFFAGNENTRALLGKCREGGPVLDRITLRGRPKGDVAALPLERGRYDCDLLTDSDGILPFEIEVIPVADGHWLLLRRLPGPAAPGGSSASPREKQPVGNLTEAIIDSAETLVTVVDRESRIVRFNRAAEVLTGYSEEEIRGQSVLSLFILEEDRAELSAYFEQVKQGRAVPQRENIWRMRDGSLRQISWSHAVLRGASGEPVHTVATGIDITAERHAESALAALSGQALNQMQGERRKLSRFLHDTVSQNLVALSFSLNRLQRDEQSVPAHDALNHSLHILDRCCRDIRLVSYILSPPLFEEIGLVPALEWYGGQLQREAGMQVSLDFDPVPVPPPAEVQAILFAVLQACVALSVRKPDKLRKRIVLRDENTMLTLRYETLLASESVIADNREELLDQFSIIRESLRRFRGTLELENIPGVFSVVARVPLPEVET